MSQRYSIPFGGPATSTGASRTMSVAFVHFHASNALCSRCSGTSPRWTTGGHDQFFYNSTGIVFPDALAAFQELNLPEGAAILIEAGRRMGGSPSRHRKERQTQLDRLHPKFDDLDERFYALDRKTNLDSAMTAYMRAHPAAFAF